MLDQYWQAHPELFVCGGGSSHGPNWFDAEAAPEDWLSITRSACQRLQRKNYKCVYLILDDHPPLASCNSVHLNQTLPRLLDELTATCIGLNGWGIGREGRRVKGEILRSYYYNLEHLPAGFTWKFSLHPTLWNLERLIALLDSLIEMLPPPDRTPWRFERLSGEKELGLSFDYIGSAYRVCGRCMTSSSARYYQHAAKIGLMRSRRFFMKRIGAAGQPRFDERLDALGQYYEGPYPLFWSGLIMAGKPNARFIDFVRQNRYSDMYQRLTTQVIPAFEFDRDNDT
ncbi:MAG: hypothetical protein OES26_16145 [Gammaproteobacteria bacterium]|nr:hypothetical protein [Gammaproteobacteria bacterium]